MHAPMPHDPLALINNHQRHKRGKAAIPIDSLAHHQSHKTGKASVPILSGVFLLDKFLSFFLLRHCTLAVAICVQNFWSPFLLCIHSPS